MKTHIQIVTTSRADFSIWLPIINCFSKDKEVEVSVIITGTHYLKELGNTHLEVKRHLKNVDLIEIPVNREFTNYDFLGDIFKGYNGVLSSTTNRPHIVLLLGDRYELLPILNTLIINRIPIGHFFPAECDISYCIDTQVRDAISKSAHLFFVTHTDYRNRLLAMGEENWRIEVSGNTNVNIQEKIDSRKIYDYLNNHGVKFSESTILVNCCYHPPTWKKGFWKRELPQMIEALKNLNNDYLFIWSGINSDPDSFEMKEYLMSEIKKMNNHVYFESLGGEVYRSLLNSAKFTIGNSSSGLYEAPLFSCPTINIGVRQGGRLHGNSVVNVEANSEYILEAIEAIKDLEDRNFINPFYHENYPKNILKHIKLHIKSSNLMLKKLQTNSINKLEKVPDYL